MLHKQFSLAYDIFEFYMQMELCHCKLIINWKHFGVWVDGEKYLHGNKWPQ